MLNLKEAIEKFLSDVKRGQAKATANTYKVGLNLFSQYLETHLKIPVTLAVSETKVEWAIDFLRYRLDTPIIIGTNTKKVAKATINTYAAALVRFYKWCSLERLITLPSDDFERLQIRLRELSGKERPTILNKVPANESIEALIKVARDTRPEAKREYDKQNNQLMYLRDIAILESLKCTGARVGELCSLTRKDLDKTNHRARVLGKGNKERWIYFSNVAWESLEEYLSARTKLARTVNPNLPRNWDTSDQPLFARHDRGSGISKVKPISPRSIQIIVESLAERADLEGNITPHKFRHWVATRLLSATGDLAATQDILGHSSPNTTRIYAQVSEQIKQTLHREVFG